jgi:hypothetical protein
MNTVIKSCFALLSAPITSPGVCQIPFRPVLFEGQVRYCYIAMYASGAI